MNAILTLDQVKVHFGGVKAVDDVSLSLEEGRLYALVGPNGSGKTTTVNAICGQYRTTAGRVELDGRRISGMHASRIYREGLARTFQGLRLLPGMSVIDNVLAGADQRTAFWGRRRKTAALAESAIDRLGLGDVRTELTGALPYGTQRRVEIARAICSSPRFLLLDEPVAGMNRGERDEIAEVLRDLRKSGLSMLLIEHDMKFVLDLADELIVMNFGRVLAQGDPRTTASLPEVQDAYLGRRRVRS
jgi:branched-chain amino acid transport system ATP-binding protein